MVGVWPNSIGDCVASGVSCASKLRVCVASLLLLLSLGESFASATSV
ncbi:hypothetical protein PR003_g31495 [Phytophthora rubi]|uniref:Uncharacterized protein n=1 Tax=Phytophthora rubi TaxID=129364 RepID=A0A6A4B9B6_9STRA|nr:hypothetical protein PR003_g31495 [Phytophthora rubi]